jgi:hypothetical protein
MLLVCLALIASCAVACLLPTTREKPVALRDLIVDASVLPEGWTVQFGPAYPPQGKHLKHELEGMYVQFERTTAPAIAVHVVLRYGNELQAAASYLADGEFAKRDSVLTPWTVPEEWTYSPATADRSRFGCAEVEVLDRFVACIAVVQYDEYISIFRTPLGRDYMTLDDLERILRVIEKGMEQYLRRDDR